MLNEYDLRLLAEIGVDVYVPRLAAVTPARVAGATAEIGIVGPLAGVSTTPPSSGHADVLILASTGRQSRLLEDLLRAFKFAGLRAEFSQASDATAVAEARNLVVLGEPMARSLGAGMPAQRHKAINWIITSEAAELAFSVSAKQGLWGEIKRLSRSLRAGGSQD